MLPGSKRHIVMLRVSRNPAAAGAVKKMVRRLEEHPKRDTVLAYDRRGAANGADQGNLTLLVRNLTGALLVLMRRMATQGAESTRPLTEFVTVLSNNLRNASFALSPSSNSSGNATSSTLPTASHDLLQTYDGFQLAVNNGMLAMSDLVRGSLKLVNPANWHVGRVGLDTVDGQTPQAGINKFIGHLFRRRG
ncbi:hypothetical protein HPB51_000428 [Rhipicephalus microplus]|uniref:Uncharacterized protein n=1 Tax=Rhipicephalus microplus TaxID=6941 RepID=A0A9J6EE93_RHIMP|nr:hypothetical protein HPB51_000428 [Rhipicephalus microplus]